ncbi:MAG TPA: hypothetical protein VLL08_23050 [Kineosporiaceae bacterium]|nr:hypothetical protein [Kineosporiaceae bacterium]
MTKSIEPRSDQLNAEDLLSGPRTFTITDVREGSAEQRARVFLAEGPEGRPWIPNVTMCRLMVLGWGQESDDWHGKRVTLYRDPDVRFGRDQPGGIRISHMSGIRKPLTANLTVTRGKREPYRVEPLSDQVPPAKVPGPMDQLVWAMNAAGVDRNPAARLTYCRDIVQRELASAKDLTPDEVAKVIAALAGNQPPTDAEANSDGGVPERDPAEPSDAEWERMQGGGQDA